MKNLFAIIGIGVALAAPVEADDFLIRPLSPTNSTMGTFTHPTVANNSNACVAVTSATNLYINVPNVQKYGDFSLAFGFKMASGSATDVCRLVGDGTYDGYTFPAALAGIINLPLAANGTTYVGTGTNLVVNSLAGVRVSYVTNTSTTIMTNLTIEAVFKPKRFGS